MIDHGDQCAVAGHFRFGARGGVNSSSLVEVSANLVGDANDVERLGHGRWRAADVSRCDRQFEHIERRPTIPLLEIGATEPAKGRKASIGLGVGLPNQRLIDCAGVGPSTFALGFLGEVNTFTNGGRFHRLQFNCGPVDHCALQATTRDERRSVAATRVNGKATAWKCLLQQLELIPDFR